MSAHQPIETCDRRGPLFTGPDLKLGIFGFNVSAGGGLSKSPSRYEIDWHDNVRLARKAEEAGFEAAIPFSRWRGFEGETNPWGRSFETYTWAAGIAASTSRIVVFSTSHSLTVSPVVAAKQLTTVDHIADGRAGLNVVAGWFEKELKMFGAGKLEHDERYDYLEEWMDVVCRLWSDDDEFDYVGKFVRVDGGYQQPKPLQAPRPPVMNAAFSPRGHQFAARYADIAFVSARDVDGARSKAAEIRALAESYGRELQVWMSASVVLGETDREAEELVSRYVSEADEQAVRNCIEWTMGGARMPPEARRQLSRSVAATPGLPLVGSASRIAEQIGALREAGIDGLALTWIDYPSGLDAFVEQVMPELERQGIRRKPAAIPSR
nr:LLM class flavin-dependent oxidoreductase [Amycolatopsis pithecellobii]